ncbi:hypothetical protein ABPG74_015118 [Tetrahymena malaccensis]
MDRQEQQFYHQNNNSKKNQKLPLLVFNEAFFISRKVKVLQDKYDKLQEEYDQLNEKYQKLVKQQEQQHQYVPKKDIKEYGYDIVISMKSINDLSVNTIDQQQEGESFGLKVQQFNKELDPNFKNVILVGMQGNRNKGKSFICNMLINQDFPSDFHLSTPGICLKYDSLNNRNIIYLDSEGGDNPVKIDYQKNQNFQEYLKFKDGDKIEESYQYQEQIFQDIQKCHEELKATQQIQQEFIIENSKIILIVVSMVSIDDQRLIHYIISKVNERNKNQEKMVLVIHNLKEFRRPEYVKDYIENELKKIYPLTQQAINEYKKTDSQEHHTIYVDQCYPFVNHLIMACQGSEASKVYNRFTLDFIKHEIGYYKKFTDFNLQEKLLDYLNKNLEKYVSFKKNQQSQAGEQERGQNFVEMCKEKSVIQLRKGYQIEKIKEQNRNMIKKKYDKIQGKFSIIFTQNKKIEEDLGEIIETTRKFEEKEYVIKISRDNELWELKQQNQEEQNQKNGVFKYEFEKEEQLGYT